MQSDEMTRWFDQPTRITRDGRVYIGDDMVPGIIAQRGVTIQPGGADDVNEITIRFIVGRVIVEDPLSEDRGSHE